MDESKLFAKVWELKDLADKEIDNATTWQERAYTAEKRVSGLEEERQRLRDEVERLKKGLFEAYNNADSIRGVERAVSMALNHKIDCGFLSGDECNCGGVSEVSE